MQLARTATCEQQAFRWGDRAYGLQFHLEMDAALIERWLRLPAYREELAGAGLPQDERSIRASMVERLTLMQPLAEATFNQFLDLVGRPNRALRLPSREGMDRT